MGIMRFSKSYSDEIMEGASREALERNACSYKYFTVEKLRDMKLKVMAKMLS